MSEVRLSVVMAVHNGMPFLPEAIDSVLRQSFPAFRLVIVDDASTDGSAAYLTSLEDKRISYLRLDRQSGQGAARNAGLAQCSTELLAFMDADDVALPMRLERQIAFLQRRPDIGLLGTHVAYLGGGGRSGFTPPLALSHARIREDLLHGRHALVNATLMFRQEVLHRAGGFRVAGAGEDWDFFLRMTAATRAANLEEVLYLYRIHEASTNARTARELRLRYAHACEMARLRELGMAETDFASFQARQAARPALARLSDRLDARASAFYRQGLAAVLHGHPVSGHARLLLAAALSPGRLAQRLQRSLRRR